MSDELKKLHDLMPAIKEQLQAGGTVRFSPNGTSMLPMLRQGVDTVVLSPLPDKLKPYDLPLYQRDNGQYVLHRIVAVKDGCFICIGDNQFQLEYEVRQDQMIGLVTSFYRGEKEYSTQCLSYRVYSRIWHWSRWFRRVWRCGKALVVSAGRKLRKKDGR